MKYIVFSDLDGTLRPKDGDISQRTIEAIKKFQESGGEFVMTTGRNRQKSEEFARAYGGSRYIIDANGGEVFDTLKRKIIFSADISRETMEKLLAIAKKFGARLVVNIAADFRFVTAKREDDSHYIEKVFKSFDEIYGKYKVVGGYFSGFADKDRPALKLEALKIKEVGFPNEGKNGNENYLDYVSASCDKGIGVKKLLQHLGASYDDAISMGDGLNDTPMFSATKVSVAMANGSEQVKYVADVVAEHVRREGSAKVLEELTKKLKESK